MTVHNGHTQQIQWDEAPSPRTLNNSGLVPVLDADSSSITPAMFQRAFEEMSECYQSTNDNNRLLRRRKANRLSQQRFRARKADQVREATEETKLLQAHVKELEQKLAVAEETNSDLRSELDTLRSSTSGASTSLTASHQSDNQTVNGASIVETFDNFIDALDESANNNQGFGFDPEPLNTQWLLSKIYSGPPVDWTEDWRK